MNNGQELRTEPLNDRHHKVLFNNKLIGYAIMDVDGYYYYEYTTQTNGFWSSHSLRMVADLLDEMNKPHDDNVKEYFSKNK
jgi:hypothetical protein